MVAWAGHDTECLSSHKVLFTHTQGVWTRADKRTHVSPSFGGFIFLTTAVFNTFSLPLATAVSPSQDIILLIDSNPSPSQLTIVKLNLFTTILGKHQTGCHMWCMRAHLFPHTCSSSRSKPHHNDFLSPPDTLDPPYPQGTSHACIDLWSNTDGK